MALAGITACASANNTIDASSATVDTSSQARIRLYGQNQKPSKMEYFQGQHKVRINTGSSFKDAFLSFAGSPKNRSLGIPATDMSTNMAQYNGILSKMFYQEFTIPANTPITVNNAFIGMSHVLKTHYSKVTHTQPSCQSDDVTFTPEAGKDYEVVPAYNSAHCGVAVLQVNEDGSTQPVVYQQ